MHCQGELPSKCRICGRTGRRFVDIFDSYQEDNITLLELILKCLDLEIRKDDILPRKICDDCTRKLTAWQSFRNHCLRTQAKLLRDVRKRNAAESTGPKDPSERKTEQVPTHTTTIRRRKKSKFCTSGNARSKKKNENEPAPISKSLPHVHSDANIQRSEDVTDAALSLEGDATNKVVAEENSVEENRSTKPLKTPEECVISEKLTVETANDVKERASPNDSETPPSTSAEPKICETCNRRFRNSEALALHIASQHGEHRCPTCKKLFKNKFSLRSHSFVHAEQRHFCCHVCGRLFRTASCLCNHVRAQHGGGRGGANGESARRPFECPHCSKLFGQRFHLAQHMRSHTGERPFPCPECPQRFVSRCQLTRHQRGRHQRDARFACEHCGRRFRYSSNYKVHLRAHEGITLQCADCDRSFTSTNGLLRHRRLHTGEKPFPCSICGKRFADCSNRKRHMVRHETGPRPPRAPRRSRARKANASTTNDLLAPTPDAAANALSDTVLPVTTTVLHDSSVSDTCVPDAIFSSTFASVLSSVANPPVSGQPMTDNFLSSSVSTNTLMSSDTDFLSCNGGLALDRVSTISSLPVTNSTLPRNSTFSTSCSTALNPVAPQSATPVSLVDDSRHFSSLRAFLESSEVAALVDPALQVPVSQTQTQVPATEMLTFVTTADGGVQQVILLPSGLLDAFETEHTSTLQQPLQPPAPPPHPPVALPLLPVQTQTSTPAPPLTLVDKEAIVRMLNSQGTTIA